ncbi:MAG: hypothetical protein WB586_16030 [Chthoniobacterales bacterium]
MVAAGNKRGLSNALDYTTAAQELMPQAKHGHPALSAVFHRLLDASSYLFRSRWTRNPAAFVDIRNAHYLIQEARQMLCAIEIETHNAERGIRE